MNMVKVVVSKLLLIGQVIQDMDIIWIVFMNIIDFHIFFWGGEDTSGITVRVTVICDRWGTYI